MIHSDQANLFQELRRYLPPYLANRLNASVGADDALTISVHIASVGYALSTYLPRYLVDLIAENATPGRINGRFYSGSAMFADVSGFTAMSEKLSALGKEGAEEITGIVNDYFETMLNISDRYGGDLLKFGGDALLIFFEGADGPYRALATGQAMQQVMSRFAKVETSQGGFPLRMSLGIGSGPIFLVSLGTADDMEYAVMGGALANMAQAEDRATAGQIMVDQATREATLDRATFIQAEEDFWLLETLSPLEPVADYFRSALEPPLLMVEASPLDLLHGCLPRIAVIEGLRPFVPADLLSRLIIDPQRPTVAGSHRPVTVMFVNFYGIDEIIEALGSKHEEAITEILNTHFVTMNRILDHYGGVVNKVDAYTLGHRIMALFGALRVHEDDPQRAVRAALEMNRAIEGVNRRTREILAAMPDLHVDFGPTPLKQRIGLNSGFVFAGNVGSTDRREYSVMGDEVNLTARLMSVSAEGQVLISQSTAHHAREEFMLEEREPVQVKGKTDPVRNFVVTGVRERPQRLANPTASPMAGRAKELEIGHQVVERVRVGDGWVLVINGASGIGKTRLAEEIVHYGERLGFDLLVGACLSYGKTMPYHPWVDILRHYFDIHLTDDSQTRLVAVQRGLETINQADWAPIIGEVLGLDIPDNDLTRDLDAKLRQQRLLDLTVELLQARAQKRPLMVVVEDAHWVDSASMALINYVARNIAGHAILLMLPHRPDDGLPDWAAYPHAVTLSLTDLSEEACLEILGHMLGPVGWPDTIRQLILSKGEGNPFFLEEVVRALIGTGALQQDVTGHKWQVGQDMTAVELPDTIHGVIISRVDRLLETDRRILQVASVVGRIFAYRILDGVYTYGDLEEAIQQRLDYLGTLGLTELQSFEVALYRFKHLTTREVVYESLSFEQRRSLHRQTANFIERAFVDTISEQTDLLAYHYFEGHAWPKAMSYNLQAARRAQHEFANETAITAYQRVLDAAAKLEPETNTMSEQLLAYELLGEVLTLVGRYEEALERYASARALVEADAPLAEQMSRLAELCRKTAEVYERLSQYDVAHEWLERGISYLDETEPAIELARIYLLQAGVYYRHGQFEAAKTWCQKSLTTTEKIQTRQGQQAMAQAYYLLGAIATRAGDFQSAVHFCRESVGVYQEIDDIVGQAKAYNNLGSAYKAQDNWDHASDAFQRSLVNNRAIGDVQEQGFVTNNLGNIYLNRGQWSRAAALFEESNGVWKQIGAPLPEAVTLSNLAQVHIYQEHWPQARTCLSDSQVLFAKVGADTFLPELERRWGAFYLQTGVIEEALAHTRRSIELAVAQGDRLEEGMSARVLGEIYLARGEREAANVALRQSLHILNDLESEYEAAKTMLVLTRLAIAEELAVSGTHLEQAIQIFEKLGAQADLAAARALAN